VRANEISGLQKLLGVDAEAEIGNLVATRLNDIETPEFVEACGFYLDHYYMGDQGALTTPDGKTLRLSPER
jgi:hypothetical protein